MPEPDHPETGRALKLIAKEEVKGAVTALSGIGTQGFLLVAQGQKCMVRGLKEDGTLLPVAFMDMQCYVSVAKELPETGLCLMADAVKGVWFTGYMVRLLPCTKRASSKTNTYSIGRTLPTPPLRQITAPHRSHSRRFPSRWQTALHSSSRRRLQHPHPTIRSRTYASLPLSHPNSILTNPPPQTPKPSPANASSTTQHSTHPTTPQP